MYRQSIISKMLDKTESVAIQMGGGGGGGVFEV